MKRLVLNTRSTMLLGGVFAVNKPPSVSSAQVIRNMQFDYFHKSQLFAENKELIRNQLKDGKSRGQRYKRKKSKEKFRVKMGHGGTLDPMATGVLILGVEHGTKQMQQFLECTKSYEATIVFGAATDSYDAEGKILRWAPYRHLDRAAIEKALEQFRGQIMQRPPLFSALRIDGKKLYEYAREGRPLPREIEKRPVEVKELEIIEWLGSGSHKEKVPSGEAEQDAKYVAEKVLHLDEVAAASDRHEKLPDVEVTEEPGAKRRRESEDEEEMGVITKVPRTEGSGLSETSAVMSGALASPEEQVVEDQSSQKTAAEPAQTPENSTNGNRGSSFDPPAVRLRMTVTSGFYVRSLSHDLGETVGSLAYMSRLVRTRQADFELGRNVLEWEEMEKGENNWGPKVKIMLETWNKIHEKEVRGEDGAADHEISTSPA